MRVREERSRLLASVSALIRRSAGVVALEKSFDFFQEIFGSPWRTRVAVVVVVAISTIRVPFVLSPSAVPSAVIVVSAAIAVFVSENDWYDRTVASGVPARVPALAQQALFLCSDRTLADDMVVATTFVPRACLIASSSRRVVRAEPFAAFAAFAALAALAALAAAKASLVMVIVVLTTPRSREAIPVFLIRVDINRVDLDSFARYSTSSKTCTHTVEVDIEALDLCSSFTIQAWNFYQTCFDRFQRHRHADPLIQILEGGDAVNNNHIFGVVRQAPKLPCVIVDRCCFMCTIASSTMLEVIFRMSVCRTSTGVLFWLP